MVRSRRMEKLKYDLVNVCGPQSMSKIEDVMDQHGAQMLDKQ